MRKVILLALVFTLCLSFVSSFSGSGSGTLANPFQITSWTQLNETRNNLTASYILVANLSSATVGYSGIGNSWVPIGLSNKFTGNFNGSNNTISDLIINISTSSYKGLFAYTFNANISNLGLINVNITVGAGGRGALVASSTGGSISNCFSTGNISTLSPNVGGLIGTKVGGSISNSYSSVNVRGSESVGGLVGSASYLSPPLPNIYNSYATGNVNGTGYLGGLVGSSGANIYNSYATGNVISYGGDSFFVGGLAGESYGIVNNSYSTGNVSGDLYVGGLFGYQGEYSTNNSYATGVVNGGEYVGGLIGGLENSNIYNSYATGNVNGTLDVGGLAGYSKNDTLNSYATGNVSGEENVGGFIGLGEGGLTNNSYSRGKVNGTTNIGGFMGLNNGGVITSSYWDINTSGQLTSIDGTGKTTIELKKINTYSGWNILVGGTELNNGYPYLAWQANGSSSAWLIYGSTEIKSCGILDQPNTVYNLTTNITNGTNDCLVISADGITINGNGFTVTGNVNASRSGEDGDGNGYNAYINLALDNITINGSVVSTGSSGANDGGAGGAITVNNSNVAGAISSTGGAGDTDSDISGEGGIGGVINITYSNVTGSISSTGGANAETTGGIGGIISISSSNISGTITSQGGEGPRLVGGAGGSINITSSNVIGEIDTTGGNGVTGGSGGAITISNSTTTTITSTGGSGFLGGAGGSILINKGLINLSYYSISLAGGIGSMISSGLPGTLTLNYSSSFEDTNAQYSDMKLKVIHNGYGIVDYKDEIISGSGLSNISSNLIIGNNSAYVNSTAMPQLNKSAEITFYGLRQRANPFMTGNNQICNSSTSPACFNLTAINNGTAIFNVSSWTSLGANYSIKDPQILILAQDITYSPNYLDDIDPETFMVFNTSLYSEFPIDKIFLEYHNGTAWANKTMSSLDSIYTTSLTTISTDANYTYKVYVNNSAGAFNETSNATFTSVWDCSFTITHTKDGAGIYSDGSLGTTGGFNQNRSIGNVTLNNTGDSNYTGGCIIKFARTSSGSDWYTTSLNALNFSATYKDLNEDAFPTGTEPGGLRFYQDFNSVGNIVLGPKNSTIVNVEGIFPNIEGDALNEFPYFPIFANVTDS
ncbi:MAG: GLUG motif-containing protein, partial [archaeon]